MVKQEFEALSIPQMFITLVKRNIKILLSLYLVEGILVSLLFYLISLTLTADAVKFSDAIAGFIHALTLRPIILAIGVAIVLHSLGEETLFKNGLKSGLNSSWKKILIANVKVLVLTFLWSLCLIIPGIIYALNRALWPIFVVKEDSSASDAINESKAFMNNQTLRLFLWYLGFGLLYGIFFGLLEFLIGDLVFHMPLIFHLVLNIISSAFFSCLGMLIIVLFYKTL